MIRTKQAFVVSVVFIILLLAANYAASIPSLPTEFYGRVRQYNENATAGNTITAYDSSGDQCGSFTIVNTGFYGVLTCKGDDPESAPEEGAATGELISFRYNGASTTVAGDRTFSAGSFKNINITFPIVFCGDSFCDVEYETNFSCSIDCPVFNQTNFNSSINATANSTSNQNPGQSTGSGSSGGTESREGADSAGNGGSNEGGGSTSSTRDITTNIRNLFNASYTGGDSGFECIERWVCGNWTECQADAIQNRTCTDLNSCDSFDTKPSEVQKCTYLPKCYDGIKNGIEQGIDCGGLCKPCISCFDGIQNCHSEACEENLDCGGPCNPCPTCFDGMKNQNEEGVDCGGSCDKKCPITQVPKPIFICKKDINPFNNDFFIFFIIIASVCISTCIYYERKIHLLRKSRVNIGIERARNIYFSRRREIIFCCVTILTAIIIYIFYYIFIMCKEDYSKAWILVAMLVSVPIIIHQLIHYLEYNERRKMEKFIDLESHHKRQLDNLIDLESENVVELLTNSKSKLSLAIEMEMVSVEFMEKIKRVLPKITKCVDNYRSKSQTPQTIQDEEDLMKDLNGILDYPSLRKECEKEPILEGMLQSLRSIKTQIEDKKKLYEDLRKSIEDKQEK